jgi:hypothetical protein
VIHPINVFGASGRENLRYFGISENDGSEKPTCFIIKLRPITSGIKDDINVEKTTPLRPYPKNNSKTMVNAICPIDAKKVNTE